MQTTEELYFSSDALAARSSLYDGLNDINLFVEDQNKEYLYETIFKRLLGDKYKITAIFPCGGKLKVIEMFHEKSEKTGEIQNFYLVDGDFDRFLRKNEMICHPHFMYLKLYNIESYFIDEIATCNFIKGKIHKVDSEVKALIGFENWKNRIVEEAKKLFFCYCYIQKYYPTEVNVARNPNLFLDYRNGFEKTDGSFEKYKLSLEILGPDMDQKVAQIIEDYKNEYDEDYYPLICGKFLLDSLFYHLKNVSEKQFKKEDLKWALISSFDIEKLSYIRDNIISLTNITAVK